MFLVEEKCPYHYYSFNCTNLSEISAWYIEGNQQSLLQTEARKSIKILYEFVRFMLLTFPNKILFSRANLVEETKPCEYR
jgi:hypothetical protein